MKRKKTPFFVPLFSFFARKNKNEKRNSFLSSSKNVMSSEALCISLSLSTVASLDLLFLGRRKKRKIEKKKKSHSYFPPTSVIWTIRPNFAPRHSSSFHTPPFFFLPESAQAPLYWAPFNMSGATYRGTLKPKRLTTHTAPNTTRGARSSSVCCRNGTAGKGI